MPTRHKGNAAAVRALNAFINLMRATDSVSSRVFEGSDFGDPKLTPTQFGVLETLHHLGPLCQRDIAKKLLKSGGNITLVIDNLEKRDLVARKTDPKDRRYFRVELTRKGSALIRKIFPKHAAAIVETMSALPAKDLETLRELCRRLGKGASQHTRR